MNKYIVNHCKKPAVFLDRDGVLNVEKSYICTVEELEIFDYARSCVEAIHHAGYLAIVVSNQSGVARGLFSEDVLKDMNEYLIEQTGVDAVYYCPHHPHGQVERYAMECDCRKPGAGMIERACREWNIDLEHSYMIGDRATDILMGQNAGIQTVLLNSGYGVSRLECAVQPDYIMQDLREFVDVINLY